MKILKSIRLILIAVYCFKTVSLIAQTKQVDIEQGESFIQYSLSHPLHSVTARSREPKSRIEIDAARKSISAVQASVDVTTFDSGNSNRDSHAMEVVGAIKYPKVTFVSTAVVPVGDSVRVTGLLRFHGVEKEISMTYMARWSANHLEINATFNLSMTAFNLERPSLLLLKVDDELKFTVHAVYPL
jgi:polyisoprenoid-binding protein YceI